MPIKLVPLTFKAYSLIVSTAFSEELERMKEFLHFIEKGEDVSDDKPWTVTQEIIPDKEALEEVIGKALQSLDMTLEELLEALSEEDGDDLDDAVDAVRIAWMEG